MELQPEQNKRRMLGAWLQRQITMVLVLESLKTPLFLRKQKPLSFPRLPRKLHPKLSRKPHFALYHLLIQTTTLPIVI